jgi:predicted enzyme related to lactoylglutathione lyase
MSHTITHIEIPSPDMKKSIDFYSGVFGWETEVMPDGKYAMFKTGEKSGGGFDSATKPAAQGVGPGLVINVEDIDATLEKIKNAGGKVVQEKTVIEGGWGSYARFTDLNENHLQIHSMK